MHRQVCNRDKGHPVYTILWLWQCMPVDWKRKMEGSSLIHAAITTMIKWLTLLLGHPEGEEGSTQDRYNVDAASLKLQDHHFNHHWRTWDMYGWRP